MTSKGGSITPSVGATRRCVLCQWTGWGPMVCTRASVPDQLSYWRRKFALRGHGLGSQVAPRAPDPRIAGPPPGGARRCRRHRSPARIRPGSAAGGRRGLIMMAVMDGSGIQRVYLAYGATDMRQSIDGLAAMVQASFRLDPFAPAVFVFGNRQRRCYYSGCLH